MYQNGYPGRKMPGYHPLFLQSQNLIACGGITVWEQKYKYKRENYNMRTILILEDSMKNMAMLIHILENLRDDITIRKATEIEEANAIIMKYSIDLFLLDIILNPADPSDVSGLRFAEHLRTFQRYKFTPIIFITALEDPRLHAYSDIHCYNYIEKPYDPVKVAAIVSEALSFPKLEEEARFIFFRKEGILYKKRITEIVYVENSRAGQVVHCLNGNLRLPYKPIKQIIEELGADKFLQCSRFTVVNRDYIEKIDMVNRYIQMSVLKEPVEIGYAFKKRFIMDLFGEPK